MISKRSTLTATMKNNFVAAETLETIRFSCPAMWDRITSAQLGEKCKTLIGTILAQW